MDLLRDDLLRIRNSAAPRTDGELEAMAGQHRDAPAPPPAVSGPCVLCKEREADAACHQCGRGVCANDRWTMLGLCRECVPEASLRQGRSARPPPDLGIKWVED